MDKEKDKEAQKLFNKALDSLDRGNWLMSVQFLRKCIETDSGYIPAYHELADIYFNNNQLDAAEAVLKDAVVVDPGDVESNFALGNVYAAKGKYTEALRLFKRLENEAGEFTPELFYQIGLAYKNLGFPELALEYLNLALEEDPSYYECLEAIGKLYIDDGKFEEARNILREALESDPGNINIHHMLGIVYSKMNLFPEAIEEWNTVLRIEPEQDEALRELGWAYNMAGDYKKAVMMLSKCLELNPKNIQARIDLGAVHMSNMRFEDAIGEWERARNEDPANPLIKKFLTDAQSLKKQKEGKGGD